MYTLLDACKDELCSRASKKNVFFFTVCAKKSNSKYKMETFKLLMFSNHIFEFGWNTFLKKMGCQKITSILAKEENGQISCHLG